MNALKFRQVQINQTVIHSVVYEQPWAPNALLP